MKSREIPSMQHMEEHMLQFLCWNLLPESSFIVRISEFNQIIDHSIFLFIQNYFYPNTYKIFIMQSDWMPDNRDLNCEISALQLKCDKIPG